MQSKPQSASGSLEGVSGSVPTAARDVCDHAVTSSLLHCCPCGSRLTPIRMLYSDLAVANANTAVFTKFRGTLDAEGVATASLNLPANLPLPPGFTFHHAHVVYDASGRIYMASNAVPLRSK